MKHMTTEDFIAKAMAFAENTDCQECPLVDKEQSCRMGHQGCQTLFLASILGGDIDLDGNPVAVSNSAQVSAKLALPKWCEVGQWVLCRDGKLWIVKEIEGNIVTVQTYPGAPCSMSSIPTHGDFRPVRFRPYTFDEARKLLGKTIRPVYGGRIQMAILVTSVEMVLDTNSIYINRRGFQGWKDLSTTIDGVPFGVPEVDEEAEREAAK